MSRTIEVIISPDAVTRVEAKGFTGSSCLEATKFLEECLGETLSRQLKPEVHQGVKRSQPQKVGQ